MPTVKALTRANVPVKGEEVWLEKDATAEVTAADLEEITARGYLDRFVAVVEDAPKKKGK